MTGSEVKQLRLSLGASYRGFAEALGISLSTVQYWEANGVDGLQDTFLGLLRDHSQVWRWLTR